MEELIRSKRGKLLFFDPFLYHPFNFFHLKEVSPFKTLGLLLSMEKEEKELIEEFFKKISDEENYKLYQICSYHTKSRIRFIHYGRLSYKMKCNELYWTIEKGYSDEMKFLIENGANVHIYYNAPLRWAVENGDIEFAKLLINKGANIHEGSLRLAAVNGHLEIVKLLVENGANYRIITHYPLELWGLFNKHRSVCDYFMSLPK